MKYGTTPLPIDSTKHLCRIIPAVVLLLTVELPCSAATHAAPAFPRIGLPWSAAAGDGTEAEKWARSGLIVVSPDDLDFERGQQWCKDEAEAFQPEPPAAGRSFLGQRVINPDAIGPYELYFFEADVTPALRRNPFAPQYCRAARLRGADVQGGRAMSFAEGAVT